MIRVALPWRTPVVRWLNGDHPIVMGLIEPVPGHEFVLDLPAPDAAAKRKARVARDALERELLAYDPTLLPADIAAFVDSRDVESQACVEAVDPDLVFLAGTPLTFGNRPWIFHIEELLPLFGPFLWSGKSFDSSAYGTPVFRMVKYLLEHERCLSIFTHLRHSADWIGRLFDSPSIAAKTTYIPFGHAFPPELEAKVAGARALRAKREGCTFLFTNSWSQAGESFVIRGGMETLLAFGRLADELPDCRLILRSQLPLATFGAEFGDFVRSIANVRLIEAKTTYVELVDLLVEADVFVIPSCGLHTVSLVEGMASGAAVIGSDAPGVDEFLQHGRTGLAVEGRKDKLSWYDDRGYLRQRFEPLFRGIDHAFVENLYQAMRSLATDRDERLRLGSAGFEHVRRNHTMGPWIDGFRRILFEATGGGR